MDSESLGLSILRGGKHIPPLATPFPSLTNCLHPFLPIPPLPIHFYPYYSSYPATLFTTSLPCYNTACSDLVRFILVPLRSIPFRFVSFCSVLFRSISFYLVSFPSFPYCSVLFRFIHISSIFFYFIFFLFFVLYLYILHFQRVKKYKKIRHNKVIL